MIRLAARLLARGGCDEIAVFVSKDQSPVTSTDIQLDVRGLSCPMPLLKAKRALNGMQDGQTLHVLATDPGSVRDFEVFTEQSGHLLLESEQSDGVYAYVLQKVGRRA